MWHRLVSYVTAYDNMSDTTFHVLISWLFSRVVFDVRFLFWWEFWMWNTFEMKDKNILLEFYNGKCLRFTETICSKKCMKFAEYYICSNEHTQGYTDTRLLKQTLIKLKCWCGMSAILCIFRCSLFVVSILYWNLYAAWQNQTFIEFFFI